MQFRAFRMPVTLATIMKIYKNTDQECHQKEIPWEGVTSEAGAFHEQKTKSKKKAK